MAKWISRPDWHFLNNIIVEKKYKKDQLLAIQNYIECEAHCELIFKGLELK